MVFVKFFRLLLITWYLAPKPTVPLPAGRSRNYSALTSFYH